MTTTTTYTCDRCKATTENNEKMWTIQITSKQMGHRYSYTSNSPTTVRTADWCEKCCDELDVKRQPPIVAEATPPPSLEDVLREVMRDEIANAESDR